MMSNPGYLGRVAKGPRGNFGFNLPDVSQKKYSDHMVSKMVSDPGPLGRIGTGGLGGALASGAHSVGGQSQADWEKCLPFIFSAP